MSSIAGYLGTVQPPSVLRAMTGRMMHRGHGRESFHEEAPVFLGARWGFSAGASGGDPENDPSNPLVYSPDRKLAIVFTGELFNLAEAGEPLEKSGKALGPAETVLRLYQAFGVGCVNRLRGEFVFAIHDQQKDLVFIARDPQGAKPLYYATTGSGTFVFASEIKALFEYPGIDIAPDLIGIDTYLSLGCSPGPDAMFKGVHKLLPGHRITWNPGLHVMIEPYWQWDSFAKHDPVLKTDDDFLERFTAQFTDAVLQRCPADQAGVFLTGSLESTCVAAALSGAGSAAGGATAFCADLTASGLMTDLNPEEAAKHLKMAIEPVAFGPQDMDKLPELVWAMDEPVADITIMPVYLMSRIAGKRLGGGRTGTIISSAGAAEMFAATRAQELLLRARHKPKSYYAGLKSAYALLPQGRLARVLGLEGKIGPRSKQRVERLITALSNDILGRQYLSFRAVFDLKEKQELYLYNFLLVADTYADLLKDPEGWPDMASALVALQSPGLLPDGIFAMIEKIAMFGGLDCRLPFADPRLAETLLGLPQNLRRRRGLLRHYLEKTQPGLLAAAQGAAKGKAAPASGRRSLLAECLAAEPLKDMVKTLLSPQSVNRRDLVDNRAVKALLVGAEAGEELCARQVFALVNLELWFRIFVDHEKGWISR